MMDKILIKSIILHVLSGSILTPKKPCWPLLWWMVWINSCTKRKLSLVLLRKIKPDWAGWIILSKDAKFYRQEFWTKTRVLHRLMGQNWVIHSSVSILGMRMIQVWLKLVGEMTHDKNCQHKILRGWPKW